MIAKRLGHLPAWKPWLPVAILVVTGALALRNLVGVVHFALHRAFEGDFAVYYIFARYSPYKFISPWPYGSPYWYPSAWTSFAMEFAAGGYFIHDAPWRSWYGPGSNLYNGTHGCVNVPYSPMATLWNWAPNGTTVVVQY